MEWPTWNEILTEIARIGAQVGLALVALLVGRFLAKAARAVVVRGVSRTDLTPSMTTIFVAIAFYGIWLLTIMAALLLLGVPSGVVVTSVGVVIVILAFSLQQSLRDLAAAVIFMLFKPFRLGDVIDTMGTTGTVEDIGPFNTTLIRWDGKVVVLPNSQIQETGLTNFSTKDSLMTDLNVRIPFGEDPDRARAVIREIMADDPRVLAEPIPRIPVLEENDSWILLNIRAGVLLGDYWDLQDSLRERIRIRLEQEGMAVPFPRADVHVLPAGDAPEGDAPEGDVAAGDAVEPDAA